MSTGHPVFAHPMSTETRFEGIVQSFPCKRLFGDEAGSLRLNYCGDCGGEVERRIPDGDNRERDVCRKCGRIHYQNPRLVVGCIPEHGGRVLLCRRAIEPRAGFWTLPAGFLELGESTELGAVRETLEEAVARVEVISLYSLISVPNIDQIHLFFRARMLTPDFAAGQETVDAALFEEGHVPWEDLAFATVRETLLRYFDDRSRGNWGVHAFTLEKGSWRGRG